MNNNLSYEIGDQSEAHSTTGEFDEVNQRRRPKLYNAFRKNSRIPWDPSALGGIKLRSALSALRDKDKESQVFRSQILDKT